MDLPKGVISIVNWNNWEDTAACISSIEQQNWAFAEVYVLDNGSVNDSVVQLSQKFPNVKITQSAENLGFAGGHHVNLKAAYASGAEWVWLLNNDAVVNENSLPTLISAYQTFGDGLFGSLTFEADGETVQYAGGYQLKDGKVESRVYNPLQGKNIKELSFKDPVFETADLHGATILLPKSTYEKYGYMEEQFFLYAEETDWCFRIRANGGKCYVVTNSRVIHRSSSSMNAFKCLKYIKAYYSTRNFYIFLKRYKSNFAETVNYFYSFHTIRDLAKFFIKYKFIANEKWRCKHKVMYYENLGKAHALLGIRGKVLNPDKFLR